MGTIGSAFASITVLLAFLAGHLYLKIINKDIPNMHSSE
jgi:hypothetical protein